MVLSAQKYPNTFRTISGIINVVYDTDVILLCDTSSGAVALDLAQIPADTWNTVYKLYVIDKSGNAGTNNITIKAPTGFTVNNASTFAVNVNNGSAIVRITSNTSYVAETNYGYPSGIIVKDEGVVISPSTTSMNFVGAGVTATAVGGDVTITINGASVTPITFANLTTLISGNLVIAGQSYLITDAIFTNTVLENVPIVVQGITSNSISLSGSGIFLNADYQQVGNYSGVTGFVSNLGVWQTTLVPVVGSVVIWNNLHYVNTTGSNGATSPDLDAVNWTVLAKNSTNGYIQEIDEVTYNVSTNQILSRFDKRINKVENNLDTLAPVNEAFLLFQWGNEQVTNNTVESNSIFECWNNYAIGTSVGVARVEGNKLHESKLSLDSNFGKIQKNILQANSSVRIFQSTVDVEFISNIFEQGVNSNFTLQDQTKVIGNYIRQKINFTIIGSADASVGYNNFNKGLATVNVQGGSFDRNTCQGGTLTIASLVGTFSDNATKNATLNVTNIALSGSVNENRFENSTINIPSNSSNFGNNEVSEFSVLTLSSNLNSGDISRNNVQGQSNVTIANDSGFIQNNTFENKCVGTITNSNLGVISENTFSNTVNNFQIVNSTVNGIIKNNNVVTSRKFLLQNNTGTFSTNNFFNIGTVVVENSGIITDNTISDGQFEIANNKGAIIGNNVFGNNASGALLIGTLQVTDTNEGNIESNQVNLGTIILDSIATTAIIRGNSVTNGGKLQITNSNNNSACIENTINSGGSVEIVDLNGKFGKSTKGTGNIVSASIVRISDITAICEFSSNVVEQSSLVEFVSLSAPSGQVTNNTFKNSKIDVSTNGFEIAGCEFFEVSWNGGLPNTQTLTGGSTASYINTIRYAIDLSDPTIYDLPTQKLTIPLNLRSWVGTFQLLNAGGLTIAKIEGLNNRHATCLYPLTGTVSFATINVLGVTNYDIVSSSGGTIYNLTSHGINLSDKIYIDVDNSGVINQVFLTQIFT